MTESIFAKSIAADAERKAITQELTAKRRELEAAGKKPKEIQNNKEILALQARLEEAKTATGYLTTEESLAILNRGSTESATNKALRQAQNAAAAGAMGLTPAERKQLYDRRKEPSFPGGPAGEWVWLGNVWGWRGGGGDGGNFDDDGDIPPPRDPVSSATSGGAEDAYYKFLKDQAQLEITERQQTARATLEALLRQFFFGSDASFVADAVAAAEGDIKSGLPTDVIILKMQNYDDPNSLFARRFSGNVQLRKAGIEPLSPAEYLEQESRYREVLATRGLGELADRTTFANLIGGQVSPFELEDRVTKVFDVYDNADAALKSELQGTLRLDPVSTRTSVAKALLLGDKGSAELQRQVRTAEVGVEARTRGLDVTAAEELARMGVTREQARAGFEQIALTQPRLTQLSEFYTQTTPDATGLQRELEREQFQGMQSQRRRRLAEQEQTSFMGQSGTAGSQSLGRRRAGSI